MNVLGMDPGLKARRRAALVRFDGERVVLLSALAAPRHQRFEGRAFRHQGYN